MESVCFIHCFEIDSGCPVQHFRLKKNLRSDDLRAQNFAAHYC